MFATSLTGNKLCVPAAACPLVRGQGSKIERILDLASFDQIWLLAGWSQLPPLPPSPRICRRGLITPSIEGKSAICLRVLELLLSSRLRLGQAPILLFDCLDYLFTKYNYSFLRYLFTLSCFHYPIEISRLPCFCQLFSTNSMAIRILRTVSSIMSISPLLLQTVSRANKGKKEIQSLYSKAIQEALINQGLLERVKCVKLFLAILVVKLHLKDIVNTLYLMFCGNHWQHNFGILMNMKKIPSLDLKVYI